MAYLLDPDSGREVEFGAHRVQEGLTLANLSVRYPGDGYPYRNTNIYEKGSREALSGILAYEARVIYRLALELHGRMSKELFDLYRHLELPLMVVLDNIRRVGIGVAADACAREVQRIEREMAILANDIMGDEDMDLRSDREVFQLLVRRGVQFRDQRVYQRQKVNARALEDAAPYHPHVEKLLVFREMAQDLGALRQMADQDRIHPVWGQTRSATSRIYARSPAVQNISRQLRHLFVAALGHVLIKADYSQAQMRILAHLSQDPELIRIFRDPNGDVHTETSKRLGLNDRNIAKEINFAICFGMGAAALARKINELRENQGCVHFIDEPTARSYVDGFYQRFPKVKDFFDGEWEKMRKLPAQKRVVGSLMGRERRFPRRPTSESERQFRVTWPQQIETDLIKTAMVRLYRIFRRRNMKARIVMMIHDALWVECPEEEAEQVRHLLRKMMTTAEKLKVPLEVDIK